MVLFESILVIMFGAVILAAGSRRAGIPYPVVLAIGGTALAFIPDAPRITLDDGLAVLDMIEAMRESAATGRQVPLPFTASAVSRASGAPLPSSEPTA